MVLVSSEGPMSHYDVFTSLDFSDLFGLVTRSAAELNERVLVFRLSQPSPLTKSQLLQQFQQQIILTGGAGGGFTSPVKRRFSQNYKPPDICLFS